jgi:hypothetical protein
LGDVLELAHPIATWHDRLVPTCGSGNIVELTAMAPATLATLQGSTDTDPAAVAAAVAAPAGRWPG